MDDSTITLKAKNGMKYVTALFDRTVDGNDITPATPTVCVHSWGPTTYTWSKNYQKCTAMSACQKCGKVDKVKATKVKRVSKRPATCTKDGEITYTAQFSKKALNKTVTVTLPATGKHKPADAVRENETAATCQAAGSYDSVVYCKVCEAELSRETVAIEKLAHTPKAAVRENKTAATCQAAGSYDSVIYCATCNEKLSREPKTIDKLAHTEVEIPAVAASCTEGGKTAGVKCSVCGTILTPQQDTEPQGHTGGTATCKEKVVCTRCGQPYGIYGEHKYKEVPDSEWYRENDGAYGHKERCSVCNNERDVVDGYEAPIESED